MESCPVRGNDLYQTEWNEISPETEVPGLEGAENFPLKEQLGEPCPIWAGGNSREWAIQAQWHNPCFSRQRGQ